MSEMTTDGLAAAMAEYSFAYLLTVNADGRAHAVAVQPTLTGDVLTVPGVGTRSRGNVGERPEVSLVWPPRDFDGYSLIVNGTGRDDGDAGVRITPSRAVKHRPHGDGVPGAASSCDSDCAPVDLG